MKLNRIQLRKMIAESIQNEGFFDTVKGFARNIDSRIRTGKSADDIIKASSEDAYDLLLSMKGLGTDEDRVRDILSKRANDIPTLYNEYNDMLMFLKKLDADKALHMVFGGGILDEFVIGGDLVTWLEDDGMEEEALAVEEALDAAGVRRKEI